MRSVLSGDRVFFVIVATLTLGGIAIFSSAALGLLARVSGSLARDILLQTTLGLGLGLAALLVCRSVSLSFWRRMAPWIYLGTLLLTALVFVPGIGVYANGATRWINLGLTTVQPAEFLKIGAVLMLASWLAAHSRQLRDFRKGLIPFLVIIGLPAILLLAQPNTSTTFLIGVTGTIMYFAAGAPWRDVGILALLGLVMIGGLLYARPYTLERVTTLLDPSANALTSGYQIRQSLIAIGSGGIGGRGFGQSVEKFNYLPEADGDSVFAVFAEEWGFVGSVFLIGLFIALAGRGIVIAGASRELFGGLLAAGFSFLIAFQALVNISAMLGVLPLTGLPLPFVSHGGTALLAALAMCGLVLNVASRRKTA